MKAIHNSRCLHLISTAKVQKTFDMEEKKFKKSEFFSQKICTYQKKAVSL